MSGVGGRQDTVTISAEQLVGAFHTFVYDHQSPWALGQWRGVPILKMPLDLMVMQELVHKLKPDVIVETGTRVGGSALFWADMCELHGHGRVVSIDKEPSRWGARPRHKRIKYITGSSLAKETVGIVKRECIKASTILVDLDSDHHRDHVFKEMEIYS